MLSGIEILICNFAVFIGATIMGTVSFGLALVVAPVLLLFLDPQSVVVIANVLIVLLLSVVLFELRRHLKLGQIKGMIIGGIFAVPLGVFALKVADPGLLRIIIGVVILILGILILFNFKIPMVNHKIAGPTYGFLSSLSITALSIGGPLAAIYVMSQRWSPPVMRVSLAFFFVSSYLIGCILYFGAGLVDLDIVKNVGLLMPGLVLGFVLAKVILGRINEDIFRYAALAVILSGSVMLLVKEAAGL